MARPRTNFPSMGGHDGSHLKYAATVDFSRKLRRLMAQRQLSQSDLARECWGEEETSDGYLAARGRDKINRYVTGRTMPDAESLKLLAKALAVPEAELAPTVVGSTLEREHPEIRMTVIAGHREHVHLTLDSVMPLECALRIMATYQEYQTRGATEAEHTQQRQDTPAMNEALAKAMTVVREQFRDADAGAPRHNPRPTRRTGPRGVEAETPEEEKLTPKQLEMVAAATEQRMERHMAKLRDDRESIETPQAQPGSRREKRKAQPASLRAAAG